MRVRRGTLDGHYDRRTESKSSATVKGGLSHLIETPDANDPEENGKAIVHTDDPTIHDSDVESRADLATRRSFDSVSGTSVAQSTIGTDLDEGEDEDADRHYAVDSSAYGSRHKAFEVAFKQKTKRLLGLVKMDGILTPSSNRQELRIRTARQRYAHKRSQDFDRVSRQASFSSLASGQNDRSFWAEDLAVPAPLPTANLASHQNTDGPSFDLQRSASSALLGTSPRLPLARRLSGLKRTVSGRSIRGTGRPGMIDDPACEDMDDLTDHREGVYDSSRKQRVPSWVSLVCPLPHEILPNLKCDRVLWRGHPVPEPQPSTHSNFLTPDDSQSRPLNRLSNAIANFGGHLRLSRIRTTSIDSTVSPIRVDRPLPPTLPPEQTLTPSAASLGTTTAHVLPQGLIPEPRRSVNRHAMYPSGSETHMQATSTAHHHLADEDIPHPSAPAKPQLTSDLARPVPTASSYSRDWSDGDGAEANRMSPTGPSLIPTHLIVNRGLPVSGPSSASPHTSGGSLSFRKRTSTLEASEAASEPPHHSLPSGAINKDEQNSAIRQFFRDLPNWLPGRSSMLMTGSSLPNEAKSERRRRMKGEIVCLHYGTLDDAG